MLKPLSYERRLKAREAATIRVAGSKPKSQSVKRHSKYPLWMQLAILIGVFILLIAAFIPSSRRIYRIGSDTFSASINCFSIIGESECTPEEHALGAAAVGIAIVMMAEIAQLLFSVGLIVFKEDDQWSKRTLQYARALATLIAITGNLEVARPWIYGFNPFEGRWFEIFSWAEALGPPLLVLWCGHILKGQAILVIEERQSANEEYNQMLKKWQSAIDKPEEMPSWKRIYAQCIRDELYAFNRRRLDNVTEEEWAAAIYHEMIIEDRTIKMVEALQQEPSHTNGRVEEMPHDFLSPN
jgi:hypothetical protein